MKHTFYSNGKLLITGEYVVLDGAKAFALPTRYGQKLSIQSNSGKTIHWLSRDADGSTWFETNITIQEIVEKQVYEAQSVRNTLLEILHEAAQMRPGFFEKCEGLTLLSELTFPKNWGLGTSSTLINNIAQWAEIDAFELLKRSFGGSGYDVACAQNDSAIVYRLEHEKPIVEPVLFNPDFTDKIHFVYLNRKQNSKAAIKNYLDKQGDIANTITTIDSLTSTVIHASDPKTFALALRDHEIEMSAVLEMQTIQEAIFDDFRGVIKSLGAWGGDFVLAIAKENPTAYFHSKGFETVIPYREMIL